MIAVPKHQMKLEAPERQPIPESVLAEELKMPIAVAAVLVKRGHDTPDKAHRYLNPQLDHLHDPKLLPDYKLAKGIILDSIRQGERIFVHGDYDVDGVTSAALFTRFLRSIKGDVVVHVPHRMKEGYGIHLNAVDAAIDHGSKLFLTCDCGVGAYEQIERARSAGMKVVVTDHHLPSEKLPRADAIVNPHRPNSKYPFLELSGVGVAFRLCEGISDDLGFDRAKYQRAFLDLAALGTVADVMPLVEDNRVITRFGTNHLTSTRKVGLIALKRAARIHEREDGTISSRDIGFVLGPRLNAAGRIDDAALSLDLLLENDLVTAQKLADEIEMINAQRKEEQVRMFEQAIELVLEQGLDKRNVIVVGHESWHPGIIGLVAGKLVERFNRPAIAMHLDPVTGKAKASCRSIIGFHLKEAIDAHQGLITGGGHAMAAGFSAEVAQVPDILEALNDYASRILTDEDFKIRLDVDADIDSGEIPTDLVDWLQHMEPFGPANMEPTLLVRNLEMLKLTATKTGEHAQVMFRGSSGNAFRAIAFGQFEEMSELPLGASYDAVFQVKPEFYNGRTTAKWQMKAIFPAA